VYTVTQSDVYARRRIVRVQVGDSDDITCSGLRERRSTLKLAAPGFARACNHDSTARVVRHVCVVMCMVSNCEAIRRLQRGVSDRSRSSRRRSDVFTAGVQRLRLLPVNWVIGTQPYCDCVCITRSIYYFTVQALLILVFIYVEIRWSSAPNLLNFSEFSTVVYQIVVDNSCMQCITSLSLMLRYTKLA
jgi:hypothetical protein